MTLSANLPSSFSVGDTLKATISDSRYPASEGWALTFAIANGSAAKTASAAASGNDYDLTVAGSVTGTWAAGTYTYTLAVTKGAERYTLATGPITLLPNLAAGTPIDGRSHARKMLDAIEAYLENQATGSQIDIIESAIDMRRVKREGKGELIKLRDRYRAEVNAEDQADKIKLGQSSGRNLQVRFG